MVSGAKKIENYFGQGLAWLWFGLLRFVLIFWVVQNIFIAHGHDLHVYSFKDLEIVGAPADWQTFFQRPSSPPMLGIQSIHNLQMWVAAFTFMGVVLVMAYIIWRFREKRNPIPSQISHHTVLEVGWTIVPIIILVIIGIPTIKLLFEMDKTQNPEMTIKVTGHQWYWTYEYMQPNTKLNFHFDSYMIADKDLTAGKIRLLDVDNYMVVPVGKSVKILVTADDVIHSFAVPSLGIKKDGVPGRMNETWFKIDKPGVYYGQCSELCGEKHGFMPIAIVAVSEIEYRKWLNDKTNLVNNRL